MSTAVLGKKVRRNVSRRNDRKKSADGGAMVGGLVWGLGRTVVTLTQWIFGIAFLVAISFGILSAYRWVTEHEFFALVNLNIMGGQRLSPEEIAAMGGVSAGMNVLSINIAEVQRRIAASEWLESVSVTRVLPDGLVIEVKEREPAFLVRRDEQLYYADVNGQPIVTVGVEKFISLPLLEKEDGVPVGNGIRQLLDAVWGYNHEGYEHAVNCHINRLRAKIEPDPTKPQLLLTVWGIGYKFTTDKLTAA